MRQNPSTMDLVGAARVLVDELEYRCGVLGEDADALLDEFLEGVPDKLGAIRHVIERLKVEAEYLKNEEDRLRERRKSWEENLDNVRAKALALLTAHRDVTGERKIKTADYTAWLATTTSLRGPDDVGDWPRRFTKEELVRKVDKKAALAALKAGEEFDGLALVERDGVRFR